MSRLVILGVILVIWSFSLLLSLPGILYSRTLSIRNSSVCILYWPDGVQYKSSQDHM